MRTLLSSDIAFSLARPKASMEKECPENLRGQPKTQETRLRQRPGLRMATPYRKKAQNSYGGEQIHYWTK